MTAAYDFQTLSPEDFERLSRDLLSAEWGKPLEIFKSGRDKGIDLRYSMPSSDEFIIVQCKRYSPTGFPNLKRKIINDELPKVEQLKPFRYVLVTSVPLTVGQKDELFELLKPWCHSPSDILGAEQVNALIASHPEIQSSHFKLWLTSTVMLQRILHSGIWNRTAATVEEIRAELCRFVTHDGFTQAMNILEEQKHCIIVGLPGIGKTTLAKILLYHYLQNDYQAVVVSGDIEEAWALSTEALLNNKKLVILYDDFLGQISFEHRKFAKNEEQRFLSLLKAVRASKNIRFILTTREYILADAKRHHAALAEADTFLEKFTLTLNHYTLPNRARILFNHLFFSDLPKSRIKAIVDSKVYQTIIHHKNYNPRIVRSISEHARFKLLADQDYIEKISLEFNDPSQVWDHAFTNDIQPNSKALLYILWSFGELATISALKSSFIKLVQEPLDGTHDDLFDRSIKELDGNFISTERYVFLGKPDSMEICVRFQNPSIRDYLNSKVASNPRILLKLCKACVRFTQVARISDLSPNINNADFVQLQNNLHELALQYFDLSDESIVNFTGEPRLAHGQNKVIAERLGLTVEIGDQINAHSKNLQLLQSWIFSAEKWVQMIRNGSCYAVADFVRLLLDTPSLNDQQRIDFMGYFDDAVSEIVNEATRLDEMAEIIRCFYKEQFELSITDKLLTHKIIDIVELLKREVGHYVKLNELENELEAIEYCENVMGVSFPIQIEELNQLILKEKDKYDDSENDMYGSGSMKHIIVDHDIEIDGLFSELIVD